MKSKSLPLFGAALWSLFTAVNPAFAQGTAFTYNGRLNDGGSPANGVYDLTFTLLDVSSGAGTVAGPLTNSTTGVTNGLFTVTLDFGPNFPGADRWLEIGVRTNGGGAFSTLTPRQQILPAPYAIYSAGAATATTANSASSVAAGNISGTLALAQLPGGVVTNNQTGVNLNGTFAGNGADMTNVNLSINSGGAIQSGAFLPASTPTVGNFPLSVATADLNQDGTMDLISANSSADTLTVLTNNGSGGFVLRATLNVGSGPQSVATADVNNDGRMDLINANASANTLTVLTNNSSVSFGSNTTLAVGSQPVFLAVADVNSDNRPDLISANKLANTLSVLTNNGGGGFVLASSPGVGASPNSVAAADVNADGKADLIAASEGPDALSILTNDGSGNFVLASSPSVGNNPDEVTAADVNGDGKVDLISADRSANTLSVLTNNGSGGFTLASSPVVGDAPRAVRAADVNGDGRVDLISADTSGNTLTVMNGDGRGGFGFSSSLAASNAPRSLAAVDVNGDGRVDLVSANSSANTLSVFFNTLTFQGNFSGSGNALTNLNASQLVTGTVPLARLPAGLVTNNQAGVTLTGTFTGNGAGLTNLNVTVLTKTRAINLPIYAMKKGPNNQGVAVGAGLYGNFNVDSSTFGDQEWIAMTTGAFVAVSHLMIPPDYVSDGALRFIASAATTNAPFTSWIAGGLITRAGNQQFSVGTNKFFFAGGTNADEGLPFRRLYTATMTTTNTLLPNDVLQITLRQASGTISNANVFGMEFIYTSSQ